MERQQTSSERSDRPRPGFWNVIDRNIEVIDASRQSDRGRAATGSICIAKCQRRSGRGKIRVQPTRAGHVGEIVGSQGGARKIHPSAERGVAGGCFVISASLENDQAKKWIWSATGPAGVFPVKGKGNRIDRSAERGIVNGRIEQTGAPDSLPAGCRSIRQHVLLIKRRVSAATLLRDRKGGCLGGRCVEDLGRGPIGGRECGIAKGDRSTACQHADVERQNNVCSCFNLPNHFVRGGIFRVECRCNRLMITSNFPVRSNLTDRDTSHERR